MELFLMHLIGSIQHIKFFSRDIADNIEHLQHVIKKKYGNVDALCKAAKANAIDDVKKLIEAGEDVNFKAPSCNKNTPLARAAASGFTEICRYLLKQPDIDVNLY